MRRDLPQPLLFNEWMRAFEASLLERAGVPAAVAGPGYDLAAYALSPEGAWWCRGDCGPQLSDSLRVAAGRHGGAPEEWRWGTAHVATFGHPLLGRLPVVGRLFTWTIAQDGDDTTLNRGGTAREGWASMHGAGYRGVYDLADLDRSLFALAPGQSGHPLRHAAASLLGRWREGTTLLLGPVAGGASEVFRLRPQSVR